MLKLRFFDFEVLPNWWCCILGDEPANWKELDDSIKSTFKVVTSDDSGARDTILKLLKEEGYCVTGYNIKSYDLAIANAIYQGFGPEAIKKISDIIVNPSMAYSSKEHIRLMPFAKRKLSGVTFQDLMDDAVGSLKEKEAILGLDILESSVPFDKEDLTDEDKADIIFYCKQDVYASMVWYQEVVSPYTQTKMATARRFNIPEKVARSITNAKLVAMALGAKRKEFDDGDDPISVDPSLLPYITENLPKQVIVHLMSSTEGLSVKLFDNDVDFGNGGIHSVYSPNLYVESNDEWVLLDVDATSYYPSLLIQQKCLSRCIERPEDFKFIFDERVRIKHKPNRTPEENELQTAYKLILNTTFGASGNKYLELYDPYQCTKTCRLGQLLLASLACKMVRTIPGLKIVQSNTDGLFVYVRRSHLDELRALEKEWQELTRINMEEKVIYRMWQRDVNNYLIESEEGVATKGGWLNQDKYRKGYVMLSPLTGYISAIAAKNFLLNGNNIVKTIVSCKDIEKFIIVCKKGPTYSRVIQKMADGTEVDLFKCNRVIASLDDSLGKIYKIKMYKGHPSYTQMPNVPEYCRTYNKDLRTYNFNEIRSDIDYMYYIQKAYDLLDIEWLSFQNNNLEKNNRFNPF